MYRVYCDGALLYHSKLENLKIFNPSLELELNKTGSFTFTIYSDHPYYSRIQKLKSIINVYQGNYLLFRGRVLDLETGFYNEKQVICEGELSFLLDSVQRPYDYTGTISGFLNLLIDSHNSQVGESKWFTVGNVTVTDPNDYIVRSNIDYVTVWEEMQKKLIDLLGGYIVVRHEENIHYIDYLQDFTLLSPQKITFGENLLDLKRTRKGAEIPTAFTLVDFNSSGRAIAFGKVSEIVEGVEFGLPAHFTHGETPSSVTYLTDGQDLDTILEPGFYAIPTTAIFGTLKNKPVTGTSTGGLIVLREGNGGQRSQIFHIASKPNGAIYERCYYSGEWGEWKTVYNGGGKILWEGAMYMTAGHKITLTEPVSKQPSGIVLVFSRYDNGVASEHNYNSFFVHRAFVAAKPGVGSAFRMNTVNFSMVATKYLYINDTTIAGNDSNDDTGTGNGVTFNNAAYVLRYVIGV